MTWRSPIPLRSSYKGAVVVPEYQQPGTCRTCGRPTPLRGKRHLLHCRAKWLNDDFEYPHWQRNVTSNGLCHPDGQPVSKGFQCANAWAERMFGDGNWLRRLVSSRDNFVCVDCGLVLRSCIVQGGPEQGDPRLAEMHHVLPLGHGGTHDLDNLVTLCKACHVRRHDKVAA